MIALALLGGGCYSSQLMSVSQHYYSRGPEEALAVLEAADLGPAHLGLGELEKAMMLIELGRYVPALELLDRAAARLDATPDPWIVRNQEDEYLGEHHERVMVRTLATATALALQDADGAANRARGVITEIERAGCEACDLGFARAVAALAFEAAGRRDAAISAVAPAAAGRPFLARQLERLFYGPDPGDGFAPPPVAGPPAERALVVLLLLGATPEKTSVDFSDGAGWAPWPVYSAMWPSLAVDARLECGGHVSPAERLLDLETLAPVCLAARRDHVRALAAATGGRPKGELKLSGWSTLPAFGALIRTPLGPADGACELVALSSTGGEVSRERIELPVEWREGVLFVLRRIP